MARSREDLARDRLEPLGSVVLRVVALADHDGDLDALAASIESGGGSFLSGTVEAKLSHLDDLRRRMADAGVAARGLLEDEEAYVRVRGKARSKVLRQGLYPGI